MSLENGLILAATGAKGMPLVAEHPLDIVAAVEHEASEDERGKPHCRHQWSGRDGIRIGGKQKLESQHGIERNIDSALPPLNGFATHLELTMVHEAMLLEFPKIAGPAISSRKRVPPSACSKRPADR